MESRWSYGVRLTLTELADQLAAIGVTWNLPGAGARAGEGPRRSARREPA